MAADHLLERGFTHFAHCGLVGVHYSDQCGACFESYLTEAGYPVSIFNRPERPCSVDASKAEVKGLLHEDEIAVWIASLPKPLGLMAGSDVRAQQVLSACAERDIPVPDQVAVTGVGNDEVLCNLCDPLLSSVELNTEKIGYDAAAMLHRMMRGETPQQMLRLVEPLRMVTRQSTNTLAIRDGDVAAAVRFIREHVGDGIAVQDVVGHVAVSRSTLQRRFASVLGRSPRQEIIRAQIERVKELLAKTDMPLARIAERAGFGHLECMSRLFKARTRLTPGQYRKRAQLDA